MLAQLGGRLRGRAELPGIRVIDHGCGVRPAVEYLDVIRRVHDELDEVLVGSLRRILGSALDVEDRDPPEPAVCLLADHAPMRWIIWRRERLLATIATAGKDAGLRLLPAREGEQPSRPGDRAPLDGEAGQDTL